MSRPPYGKRVLATLQAAIRVSNVKQRSLETALGVSRGYLSQVFSGRIELKMWHVEKILESVGFEPGVFFDLAYSPGGDDEAAMMTRFTAYTGRQQLARAADVPLPLRVMIAEVVRDMLAEGGGPGPAGEPGGGPPAARPTRPGRSTRSGRPAGRRGRGRRAPSRPRAAGGPRTDSEANA